VTGEGRHSVYWGCMTTRSPLKGSQTKQFNGNNKHVLTSRFLKAKNSLHRSKKN
jgi:hypothetical protein